MAQGVEPHRDDTWQRAFYVGLTILVWLAIIVVAIWLLSHVVKTLLTLILSGVVAFALTPLVSYLKRWMPRPAAIALTYVLAFSIILGLGALVVGTAAAQVTTLVDQLPNYGDQVKHLRPQIVRLLHPFGVTGAKFDQTQKQLIAYLQTTGTGIAKDSVSIITSVVGTIVDVVLVLILSVYLTANGPQIAQNLRRETPTRQRRYTNLFIAIVNQVLGGYIRGQLTLAALIGLLVGAGMFVLRVKYAVLLGILAFFMEFIPIVGVLVSGAVCVLIALFQGWKLAIFVVAYFVLVHVIEGDLVGPRIVGRAVGIHPATALIGLVAGTELFGFWGALFAAPLAGLLQAIGTAIYLEIRGGDPRGVLNAVTEQVRVQADERATPVADHMDGDSKASRPGVSAE